MHIKVDSPKNLDAKQRALLKAYAELERDTPGTVDGFTFRTDGSKVCTEDGDGLVAEIREALEETGAVSTTSAGGQGDNKDKA